MAGPSAFCSSELGRGFVQHVRQESLGAEEGRFCRNCCGSGLVCLLGQQKTANAGLMVFTNSIKKGRGVLPNKDEETDNDRKSITWKNAAFELDPLHLSIQTQLLPGSNLQGCINPYGTAGYQLVNYHCMPGHLERPPSPPRGKTQIAGPPHSS